MPGVLEGVKVLDLASMWAIPLAGAYLADQGAEVIKVEPLAGDNARRTFSSSPMPNNESRSWIIAGRGKRSIAVNIARPEGKEIIHRLVKWCDVVLNNFRLEGARRLGYDYESLRRVNPRLIYARLSAFGDEGPYAGRRGYDRLFQAMSGMMRQASPDSPPVATGIWASDMSTPWAVCYGVALALLHRERTGQGQEIETSLLHMAMAMQAVDMVGLDAESAPQNGNMEHAHQTLYLPYRCSDDKWIDIVIISDGEFVSLCHALGEPHLAEDERFATALSRTKHSGLLRELLDGLLSTKPLDEWLTVLKENDVPCAPVVNRKHVLQSEQVKANGYGLTMDYPGVGKTEMVNIPLRIKANPGKVKRRAPLLGEHTREILEEAGFTPNEVKELFSSSTVG